MFRTKDRFPELSPIPSQHRRRHDLEQIMLLLVWVLGGVTSLRAAKLEGTVTDPSGQAVVEARVSLLSTLRAVEERQTDSRGNFHFDGLAGGTYQLVASAPGFSALPTEVVLRDGETQKIDLPLQLSVLEQHVVVSATLGGALAPQVGSSVSIITSQDIEDRDAENLFEVLRGVPGVEVNQTGRRGGVTGVFVRGGNSNYNLVMVDGIEVNEFGGGPVFDFASLPADGVERVEVTRGPESAIYGSNAVTSVINIVSRRGDGPPHFSILSEGGSFNTHRFSVGGSGLERGLGWAFNLSKLVSQGVVANDRYRDQSAFLGLDYSRSPRRQVSAHFFGNANDAGAPGAYGSDPDHLFPGIDTVSRDKQNLFGYQASYAEQFSSRFRQVTTLSLANNDFYFRSPPAFGDSFSRNTRVVANTRSELTLAQQDFLVAGFEYNREQIRNTFIANAQNQPFLLPRTSLAYFAENRWNPMTRLFLIAGIRVDDLRTHSLPPDAFGFRPLVPPSSVVKVNPRISAAYVPREGSRGGWLGATRLHGSFGTGIRAPDGFELAFTNNPRLKPEKSLSFDSGVEQHFFGDRALVDATYFYNRFKDQIVVLGGSLANLSTFISDNLGNTRAEGMELSFRARPTRSLFVSGEYTLLASSILSLEGTSLALAPFHVGQPLIRRPKNSGFLQFAWRHGPLVLSTNAILRGRTLDVEPNNATGSCVLGLPCLFDNKGYARADAGFSYRLPKGLEIYGRLNNFLNRKYEEVLGFPALRLNFLVGLRISLPPE